MTGAGPEINGSMTNLYIDLVEPIPSTYEILDRRNVRTTYASMHMYEVDKPSEGNSDVMEVKHKSLVFRRRQIRLLK